MDIKQVLLYQSFWPFKTNRRKKDFKATQLVGSRSCEEFLSICFHFQVFTEWSDCPWHGFGNEPSVLSNTGKSLKSFFFYQNKYRGLSHVELNQPWQEFPTMYVNLTFSHVGKGPCCQSTGSGEMLVFVTCNIEERSKWVESDLSYSHNIDMWFFFFFF